MMFDFEKKTKFRIPCIPQINGVGIPTLELIKIKIDLNSRIIYS